MLLDLHRNKNQFGKICQLLDDSYIARKPASIVLQSAIMLELINQYNMINQTLISYPSAVSSAPMHVSLRLEHTHLG